VTIDNVPVDDISLKYIDARPEIRSAVSLLLEEGDQFLLYTEKGDSRVFIHDVMEEAHTNCLYNILSTFVQRYGHYPTLKFFAHFFNSSNADLSIVESWLNYFNQLREKMIKRESGK
jgi:hypothetical protein